MSIHGGSFRHHYAKSEVTHVIANNLAFGKIGNLQECDKIVRPEWIVDSIKASRQLPVLKYLVYQPGQVGGQQCLQFEKLDSDDSSLDARPSELVDDLACDVLQSSSNSSPIKQPSDELIADYVKDINASTLSIGVGSSSRNLKAGDPGFLEAYFNKSRLHHLSTAGNEFKSYVEQLRRTSSKDFSGIIALRELYSAQPKVTWNAPIIMHIDMDW